MCTLQSVSRVAHVNDYVQYLRQDWPDGDVCTCDFDFIACVCILQSVSRVAHVTDCGEDLREERPDADFWAWRCSYGGVYFAGCKPCGACE